MIYTALTETEVKEWLQKNRQEKKEVHPQVTQWFKEVKKEKQEPHPEKLIQEQAERVKGKAEDRVIKEGRFIRDLNKVLKYLADKVTDPTRHGLIKSLVELSHEATPSKIQQKAFILKAETQKDLIDQAARLKDSGDLLQMLSNLFTETYEERKRTPRFASISDILKKIATQWEEKGDGWSLIENASTFTLKIQGNKALEIPRDKKYIDKLDSACKKMLQRVNEVPFA